MRRTQILSPRDIKSIHSAGIRSIPKVQRSSYLELYTLSREKDRLEKELFVIEKRRNGTGKQLESINKRIEKLQKEVSEEQKGKIYKHLPISKKALRTMAINY